MAKADRLAEMDVAAGSDESVGQAARVEANAGGERVVRLARHHGGAERLEPGKPLVQPLEYDPLERRVSAGALGAKLLERAVAPDHAAREQHRAAGPVALLEHERLRPELARPRGRAQAGHSRARYEQLEPW